MADRGSRTSGPGRPLRVLMLIDRLRDTGGAERLLWGLATHLPSERCEVTVCTTREAKGRLPTRLREAGIPLLDLERGTGTRVLAFRRLIGFLRREDIDVVHAHTFGSNAWGAVCGCLARVPVIVAHEHGSPPRGRSVRGLIDRRVTGRLADAVVVGSSADRERMIEEVRVPPAKVVFIPGAYIPRPAEEQRDFRAELELPPDVPLIGTVAVLRPEKAISVLIEAFARLAPSFPDARLVIYGRGPCRAELKRQAAALALEDRVLFPGPFGVESVLEALDVAAISSDREGTSLFSLECMAHRVPLVATEVGGLRDTFESGVSALLVPPRDPEALATGLATLLANPSRGKALASAAIERLNEFTIDRAAGRFVDLYQRLYRSAA